MSRTVVALMIRTSIPFSVWLDQPDGVIETALELLAEQNDGGDSGGDGRVMGG
jgi:hypothetical protein